MNKLLIAPLTLIATCAIATGTAAADESNGCVTVDYQGTPLESCPVRQLDPTNCYTGWYQGLPIEICMPTGDTLPEGSTFNGEPVVIHESITYVAPTATVPADVVPMVGTLRTFFDK